MLYSSKIDIKVNKNYLVLERGGNDMSIETSEGQSEAVNAVVRTMALLELLAQNPKSGLTELSKMIGISKSTVFRFLNTLCDLGYVYKDPYTERFELSFKLQGLATSSSTEMDIKKFALPSMEQLAQETGETIHLGAMEQGHLVYLHKIESQKALRVVAMQSAVGKSAPLYCTGVGKALMAWQDQEFLDRYLQETVFNVFTSNTIHDRLEMAAELHRIHSQGYAIDNEEHEVGVRCVAAPIFTMNGKVAAAMSISGPSVRMTASRMTDLSTLIVEICHTISQLLGAQG